MLRLSHISKTYGTGRGRDMRSGEKKISVFSDITVEIQDGEFVAIMGKSGVGKSTLLRMMATLDKPDAGEILYDEMRMDKKADDVLAEYRNRSVGFVFQDALLIPTLTVLENVLMPFAFSKGNLKSPTEKSLQQKRAEELLHEVGLEKRKNHFPHELSGGEAQRACIARALVMNPPLLLADEPTGNLDTITGGQIIQLLKKLHREHKQTLVIATHDPEIAAAAERVMELHDGVLQKNP